MQSKIVLDRLIATIDLGPARDPTDRPPTLLVQGSSRRKPNWSYDPFGQSLDLTPLLLGGNGRGEEILTSYAVEVGLAISITRLSKEAAVEEKRKVLRFQDFCPSTDEPSPYLYGNLSLPVPQGPQFVRIVVNRDPARSQSFVVELDGRPWTFEHLRGQYIRRSYIHVIPTHAPTDWAVPLAPYKVKSVVPLGVGQEDEFMAGGLDVNNYIVPYQIFLHKVKIQSPWMQEEVATGITTHSSVGIELEAVENFPLMGLSTSPSELTSWLLKEQKKELPEVYEVEVAGIRDVDCYPE